MAVVGRFASCVVAQHRELRYIAWRVIVNFHTAKRLLAALHMAVHRHETAFGVLEMDVFKRVRSDRGGS